MAAGFGLSYAKWIFEGYVLHQSAKSAARLRNTKAGTITVPAEIKGEISHV